MAAEAERVERRRKTCSRAESEFLCPSGREAVMLPDVPARSRCRDLCTPHPTARPEDAMGSTKKPSHGGNPSSVPFRRDHKPFRAWHGRDNAGHRVARGYQMSVVHRRAADRSTLSSDSSVNRHIEQPSLDMTSPMVPSRSEVSRTLSPV